MKGKPEQEFIILLHSKLNWLITQFYKAIGIIKTCEFLRFTKNKIEVENRHLRLKLTNRNTKYPVYIWMLYNIRE